MKVVIGVVGALALGSGHVALAEPRLEASGFVGIDYFGDNIQLGNSWAAEQIPGTSVLFGGRLLWVALPALATPGGHPLALGVEGEVAISPASTGDLGGSRMAYFAPVFGWHAHAMLRLGLPTVRPHLVLGAGGETIASTSPFMTKETDPVVYWGLGASSALSARWQLRLDLRHGIMPAREGAATSTLEFQIGVGATFGLPRKIVRAAAPPPPPHQPRIDETDTDEDGLPDWLDNCPRDAETVNGIADEDGCPETDPDNDGLVGDADACPADAEDLDGFEDGDGCPDADNDRDGILDVDDTCPDVPETRNGFVDDDGCP
ncbi:MAG: thrombospondin type 3 repeat-containing protein, partial [Proteobacteria bacterium]|nr:thrombospondin type 3 repeat-containing protein [Pseudomonadota bacterium]